MASHEHYRSRFHHLILIDQAIREGCFPSSKKIGIDLELSDRTVRRNIEFMRYTLGAPIEYDASRKGYHYSDKSWSLPNIQITKGELLGVALAQMALQAYKGTPLYAYVHGFIEKLQAAQPEVVQVNPAHLANVFRFSFGPVAPFDPEHWQLLADAAQNHRTVWMRYHAIWKDVDTEREVDPYLLRCFRGDWYLIAHDHKTGYIPIFDLARIRELRETKKTFFVRDDFDPEEYLSGTFQVSETSERHKVRIQFFGVAARFIAEKVWHPSQKLTHRKDGSVILEMTLADLGEVAAWVLSWGRNARVLAPAQLAEIVCHEARGMLRSNEEQESRHGPDPST